MEERTSTCDRLGPVISDRKVSLFVSLLQWNASLIYPLPFSRLLVPETSCPTEMC